VRKVIAMKHGILGRPMGRSARKAGMPPGSLVYTGEQRLEKATIDVIDFDSEGVRELPATTVEKCLPFKESPTVTWMNVTGLHDVELIRTLGERFDLHPLVLEDVLSTGQRPKFEDFGSYIFMVIKTLHGGEDHGHITTEQISIVVGSNFVITFQEIPEDPFERIRERIRTGGGRVRTMGADYLAYSLMDAVVDHYFVVLERLGDAIETLGEEAVSDPTPDTLHAINAIKHELSNLRRMVWPLREVISGFQRSESDIFSEKTEIYLRDVYDHTIQVVETIETFRDIAGGMFDTYLSSVSNRMNEVMKVLTIIATIFIPITFVAGVYGMNFRRMPELGWAWGYPGALLVMLAVALVMIAYFRKRRWL
jgi:magnesium transporter